MRLFGSVLLVLSFLAGSAVATQATVLEVDPPVIAPGDDVSFIVAFPDGAEGTALLSLGDGRSHEIPASVGEVEVIEPAPDEPGRYRATLEVTVNGSMQTYETAYEVDEESEKRENPGLAGGMIILSLGAWVVFSRRED